VVVPHKEATFWMRIALPLNISIFSSEAGKPPQAKVFADKSKKDLKAARVKNTIADFREATL